jgi:hypothetical protein
MILLIYPDGTPFSITRDISYEEYADVQNGLLTIIRFHNGQFQELETDLTWTNVPAALSEVPQTV